MTEKEARKEVMRRANALSPTVHVGKDGLDEGVLEEIRAQLKTARIVKIKVLGNGDAGAKELAGAIAAQTASEAVDVRGGVIVLADERTWSSLCQKKF